MTEGRSIGGFDTTHWSLVLAAGGQVSSADSRQALEELCGAYWYPLYAFVRRKGHGSDDAEDLTQQFFTSLLERGALQAADPDRGRFRSFLLASLKNFLSTEWRRATAKKRGGGKAPVSLDFESAEKRYSREPVHELTPERIYERRWALTLLEDSLDELRREMTDDGRGELYDHLNGFLEAGGEASPSYDQVAEELGISAPALRMAATRLRRRFRTLVRRRIADTAAGPEDVEDELRHLFEALGA